MYDNYYDFISQQEREFIEEIHGEGYTDISHFGTRIIKSCTLEELEELDNRFINDAEHHNPEGI